jgi:hypothetical protein
VQHVSQYITGLQDHPRLYHLLCVLQLQLCLLTMCGASLNVRVRCAGDCV